MVAPSVASGLNIIDELKGSSGAGASAMGDTGSVRTAVTSYYNGYRINPGDSEDRPYHCIEYKFQRSGTDEILLSGEDFSAAVDFTVSRRIFLVLVRPQTWIDTYNYKVVGESQGWQLVLMVDGETDDDYRVWSIGGDEMKGSAQTFLWTPVVISPNDSASDSSIDIPNDESGAPNAYDASDIGRYEVLMQPVNTNLNTIEVRMSVMAYLDPYVLTDGDSGDPGTWDTFLDRLGGPEYNDDLEILALHLGQCYINIKIGNGSTATYFDDADRNITWPGQAQSGDKLRNCHVGDNEYGIEIDAAAGDTAIFRRYKFARATAFYVDCGGAHGSGTDISFINCVFIGPGVTTINSDVTLQNCVIVGRDMFAINGADISGGTIENPSDGTCVSMVATDAPSGIDFVTDTGGDYAIEIAAAGTYTIDACTFSGFTKDINVTASSGTVTINITGGGDTPTYDTAGATVVINNSVTIKVTCLDESGSPIENVRVYLEAGSGGPETQGAVLLNALTNASGIAQDTGYNYQGSQPLQNGRARKSTSSPLYKQASVQGTIGANGFDATVTMVADE